MKKLQILWFLLLLSVTQISHAQPCACDDDEVEFEIKIRKPASDVNDTIFVSGELIIGGNVAKCDIPGKVKVRMRRGQTLAVSITGDFKSYLQQCPQTYAFLEVPCGAQVLDEQGNSISEVILDNDYPVGGPFGGILTDGIIGTLSVAPVRSSTRGPTSPGGGGGGGSGQGGGGMGGQVASQNAGSQFNPGASAPVDVVTEGVSGLQVETEDAAVRGAIPLGFVEDGGQYTEAGFLSFAHPFGSTPLTVASFRVDSFYLNPDLVTDVTKEVHWVSDDVNANPRIVIAEECVSRISNTANGALVEVFPVTSYSGGTFSGNPISKYAFDRLSGGDKIVISQWIDGSADPVSVKEFELDGTKLIKVDNGIKTTVQNVQDLDLSTDDDIRASFRETVRETFQITPDGEVMTLCVVESYGYLPRYEVTGESGGFPVFGDMLPPDEVLLSRCNDRDGNLAYIGGPTTTFRYYGEGSGLAANQYLSAENYHLLGEMKMEQDSESGSWKLYGYDSQGYLTVTYEPWKSTVPPTIGATTVIGLSTSAGTEVKKTVYVRDQAPQTSSTITETYFVQSGSHKMIGRSQSDSSSETSFGDNRLSVDGDLATLTQEYLGSWPGGDVWGDFNFSPTVNTHKMIVRTRGTMASVGRSFVYSMSVVPEHSTQEIEIYSGEQLLVSETRVLPAGGSGTATSASFEAMTRETRLYDSKNRLVEVLRDGRRIQALSYPSLREVSTTDEEGRTVTVETDAHGRTIRETTASGGGVSEIVKTYEYAGLTTRVRVNGIVVSETKNDLAGRLAQSIDEIGFKSTYFYQFDGVARTSVSRSNGTSIATRHHRDGRIERQGGTGQIEKYYEYGVEADPVAAGEDPTVRYFSTTTERIGYPTSERFSVLVTHWDGSEIETRTPDAFDGTSVVARKSELEDFPDSSGYSAQSVVYGGTYSGTGAAAEISYPAATPAGAMGMHRFRGKAQGWSSGAPTASRLVESITQYTKDGDGRWWEKATMKRGVEETHATVESYRMRRMWEGDGRTTESKTEDGEVTTVTTIYGSLNGQMQVTEISQSNRTPEAQTVRMNGYVQSANGRYTDGGSYTYQYDGFGRLVAQTDSRGAKTSMVYNEAGQMIRSYDSLGRATTYEYVNAATYGSGQVSSVTKADGTVTRYKYTNRGELSKIEGDGAYEVIYGYDTWWGDRTRMITSTSRVLWRYNPAGLLMARYNDTEVNWADPADGSQYFEYDPYGRLVRKSVVGGAATEWTYNVFGELTGVDYGADDSSDDVVITRDDAGLIASVAESFESADGGTGLGSGTTTYSYAAGKVDEIVYSGGHSYLPAVKLDYRSPDAAGRLTGYDVLDGSTPRLDVAYGYDAQGRVGSVSSSIHGSFTYGYHPGSGIVSGYVGSVGGSPVFGLSRTVDSHGRIASVVNKNGAGQVLASVGYSYDRADRRTQARREDGSYWNYGYNTRGEVTASTRHKADNTSINGLERQYSYDGLGNRNWAKFGGGESGTLTQIDYMVNTQNQYTSISHPGKAWVVGRAPEFDPVEVNSLAAGKQGNWFSKELTVSNSSNPVNFPVVVEDSASNEISSGNVAVPKATVAPAYDPAGNLVNDGRWVYEWDSVNRLRKMTTTTAAVSGGFPEQTIEFVYDWQDRRIAKKVTVGINVRHTRYLYEEWNVVAEWTLHGSSTTLLTPQTNLWGLDLAGQNSGDVTQIQEAGGVSGLLAVDVRKISDSSALGKLYASYDGNGNILAWIGTDGLIKRSQDYDAFGNVVLRDMDAGGPLASGQGEVGYGFSTKIEEGESGLLYYGYRYYDPVAGRWPSRDPIEEDGGINLYGNCNNNAINCIDVLGKRPDPEFIDFTEPGKPVGGMAGKVWFIRHRLDTEVLYAGSGNSQIVDWSLDAWAMITGFRGDDIGTQQHEQRHIDDARNTYNHYIKEMKSVYVGKCMSSERAQCFNQISPLYSQLVNYHYRVLADHFHAFHQHSGYGALDRAQARQQYQTSLNSFRRTRDLINLRISSCNLRE